MPPKRNKRKRGHTEMTDTAADTTQRVEDEQGTSRDTSTEAGSGRSTAPLTRGDIPALIQEITRQLRPEGDTPLTPSTYCNVWLLFNTPPHSNLGSPICQSLGPWCPGADCRVVTCTSVACLLPPYYVVYYISFSFFVIAACSQRIEVQ